MKLLSLALALAAVACSKRHEPPPRVDNTPTAKRSYDQLSRADFNRLAVRLNLPVFWIEDANKDGKVSRDEVASLMFYPTQAPDLDTAYDQIVAASKVEPPTDKRRVLVRHDLDQGRPTLVLSSFKTASAEDKELVKHMIAIATAIDAIYDKQTGAAMLAPQLPPDAESRSLFRRNRGPRCVGPATEGDPLCSAIPGSPKPIVDVYPPEIQKSDDFCKQLEARKDAKDLLTPFTVVRGDKAVGYHEEYKDEMTRVSQLLTTTADAIKDPAEQPLVRYLRAAANSFKTNQWLDADEAWAKMTVDNSRWYVRVGADETYWEPCSHKAGFHLTFAKINQGSKEWQGKLVPVQQEMEAAIASRAGAPYRARKVTFHLPDFIDIVINAGDDRNPLGATIGESLPNWGPVAEQGRGRTVAMVNFYKDGDSLAARRAQAESVLDATSAKLYAGTPDSGLLSTILHEATHNLGPANEYKIGGKSPEDMFGGPIASVFEELKAQTGALFLLDLLRTKKIITDEQAQQSFVDAIVWAFGHISQGMYTGSGTRKTYGNVAAIQIGFLIEHGALTWDDKATAANGKDQGAFVIHTDKLVAAADEMMKLVGGIKARGDRAAAEQLIKTYVDGTVVPHKLIQERFLRFPKANFVYSIDQ